MTRKFGWTKATLTLHIENRHYQKALQGQTNFKETLPKPVQADLHFAVKDEYTFDFLNLTAAYSERQLEKAILQKVEPFLREMGGVFSFIGSQFKLTVADEDYFIDLLLYHRRLKCLVAIELKIGKFLLEHIGKMQFYLAALDALVREKEEAPSIGIILCKEKNRTVVEYALKNAAKPIGVATYTVTSTLPKALRNELPAPEQVALLLQGIDE